MPKKKPTGFSDAIRRSDEKRLAEGGLNGPHTKIGVGTAKRLVPYHPKRVKELQAYIKSAPSKMPVSDYEAEHGPIKMPKAKKPLPPALPYREIPGERPDSANGASPALPGVRAAGTATGQATPDRRRIPSSDHRRPRFA